MQYSPSASTGCFGSYCLKVHPRNVTSEPSLLTDVFDGKVSKKYSIVYKPSHSTGVFGAYHLSHVKPLKAKMQFKYRPSISNGIFGSFVIQDVNEEEPQHTHFRKRTVVFAPTPYRPSASSGIFGSFTLKTSTPLSAYEYRPSVSTGVFGSYCLSKPTLQLKILDTATNKPYAIVMDRIERPFTAVEMERGTLPPKGLGVEVLAQWDIRLQLPDNSLKNVRILVASGSVVHFCGDCIVNAANEGMLGGGGVDGAITSAGGDILDTLRRKVPVIPGSRLVRCRVGDAKLTQSGYPSNRLKCRYVAHAVGPNYSVMTMGRRRMTLEQIDEFLYDAYYRTMQIAHEHNEQLPNLISTRNTKTLNRSYAPEDSLPEHTKISSIAFSLLSAGIFRGPQSLRQVLKIAVEAIYASLEECYSIDEVVLVGFTSSELDELLQVTPKVLGPGILYDKYRRLSSGLVKFNTKKGFSWNKGKSNDQTKTHHDNHTDESDEE